MGPDRDHDPDDANRINYPSPTAETMDAGPFYSTGPRDDGQDQHADHQVAEHEQHHFETHEHEHEHDHEHKHQIESQDDQNHNSRPANLEELRLAAQLGHGLAAAPMMHAADHNMGVEDPNLRAIMPHPEAEHQEQPPYLQEPEVPPSMPQAPMAPAPTAQHPMPLPMHYQSIDSIPPRKRSKVSRACDECRRKKIKCDATSDSGETPCTSCARSSIRCLFSRIPQKRGPSKGYIKELADRIHSIENKLESEGGLTQDEVERLFAPDNHRQPSNGAPGDDPSRKRPFSSISTGDYGTPTPARQTPWGTDPRPIQPAGASDTLPYSENSLAPQPSAFKPDDTPSKSQEITADISMTDGEEQPDIDETLLQHFHAIVQPVYPILPSTKPRLQSLLSESPSQIRRAFASALLAVSHSPAGNAKLASSLLSDWESGDSIALQAGNIVHAQTLLLLIIDADSRASSSLPFLLARAVALANSMKLWKYTSIEVASEQDSDEQLCVRIWWSLVLMDRWHAAGTGKPSHIPDNSVVAPPGLVNALGEGCFHMTRLSKLLNRISFVISTLSPGVSTAEPPLAGILSDYIENWREDLPPHIEPGPFPTVHLAYWHCRLLVYLLTPGATPAQNWWATKELAALLSANAELRSPLTHHFASLAAMSLAKLARTDDTRDQVVQLVEGILERPGGVWDGVRDRLAELLRPSSSAEATAASRGLQHLADLATAYEGIGPDEIAQFSQSLVGGYLDIP